MDPNVSKWIVEFLIRQPVDDSLLDCFVANIPTEAVDYGVKKGLLLRRIQTTVSQGIVSEKILDLLELIVELDFDKHRCPSETIRSAYCVVALDRTLRFLEVEDLNMYSEALDSIWRVRFQKMEKFGLINDELRSLRRDLESASSNVKLRDKILSRNWRYLALKEVKGYLRESWSELGPSFLEKTAEDVYNSGKTGQGNNPSEAGRGINNVDDKELGFALHFIGDEDADNIVLEDMHVAKLKPLIQEYNKTPNDTPSVGNEGSECEDSENVTEVGNEQVLESVEGAIEGCDGIAPSHRPSSTTQNKQGLSRTDHVGVLRKIVNGIGTKAKICDDVEVGEDTGKNDHHCCPIPEVNGTRADDLNAVVRDPLPEDTGVGGTQGTEMNQKRDHAEANNDVGNIRGAVHPEKREFGDDNHSTSGDLVELTKESFLKRQRTTPVNSPPVTKGEKRRLPRKWTNLEEDILRKGVMQFGRGNWKNILKEYSDTFEGRTEVDLKDKWRNMT